MDHAELPHVVIARATEQLRQERETFDQAKRHDGRWFILRLAMGYYAVLLLGVIMAVASYVLLDSPKFPTNVVSAAGAALFVDVVGLLAAVWKIALNPSFSARLTPLTQIALPDIDQVGRSGGSGVILNGDSKGAA